MWIEAKQESGNNIALPGGALWTVPELSFEKKQPILALHHSLITDRTHSVD